MIRGIVSSFRILTIIPVPGKDAPSPASAAPLFWVPALLLGFVVWGLFLASRAFGSGSPAVYGVAALGIVSLLTGFLHLDGLADSADAFGGARGNRERILAIMKDSCLGSYGVCSLILVLGLKGVLWYHFFEKGVPAAIVLSILYSRTALATALVAVPCARPGGLCAGFAGSSSFVRSAVICAALGVLAAGMVMAGPVGGAVPWVGGVMVSLLWVRFCIRTIGGITGDCLGAMNEFHELAVLGAGFICTEAIRYFP